MPRYGEREGEGKVYVGDLPRDVTDQDLKRPFGYYGPVKSIWVARNPPGFAFVEFEDSRDADDAVRGLDGTTIAGSRVKVEHSTGKVRPKPWLSGGGGGGGGGRGGGGRMGGGGRRPVNPNDRCYQCGEKGHYSYDCRSRRGGASSGGGSRRRSRSRSRSRSYDRRRSPSRSRSPRSSRSRSRSRD